MKLEVFTVMDKAVNAYLSPFFVRTEGEAYRMLAGALNDPNHLFAKHPTDYRLYRLGTYDDATGLFALEDAPVFLTSMEQLMTWFGLDRVDSPEPADAPLPFFDEEAAQ